MHGPGSDVSFTGQLTSEGIRVHYAQESHSGNVVNHIENYGGTDIQVDFTMKYPAILPVRAATRSTLTMTVYR